jgi:hypothetical protein
MQQECFKNGDARGYFWCQLDKEALVNMAEREAYELQA